MQTPLRILHVIHSGAIGGGPRVVLDLATRCPGVHEIATAADGPLLDDARLASLQTFRLPHAGEFSMGLTVPALIRRFQDVDIVHLHGQFAAFYGALAALPATATMVYTAHFPSFATDSGPVIRSRNHLAEFVPCRVARMVVTCSETSRIEYLRRRLAPPTRVVTIYNGVPSPAPPTGVEGLRRELDLDASPVVLALGRFTEQKGFDLLVDAFSHVLPRFPHARLVLVGDGPLRTALEQQSRQLGISSAVRFTGFRRDTSDFYHLASVVAVPSLYDIFPLVPLEAMRIGRPVVASDLPAFREALREGETGMLAPRDPDRFAAALISLLSNPRRSSAMGQCARVDAAKRFTVERMVDEYADLYAGLRGAAA
jgi:glycosyltransferase involved in cell wall biosynthesis